MAHNSSSYLDSVHDNEDRSVDNSCTSKRTVEILISRWKCNMTDSKVSSQLLQTYCSYLQGGSGMKGEGGSRICDEIAILNEMIALSYNRCTYAINKLKDIRAKESKKREQYTPVAPVIDPDFDDDLHNSVCDELGY